MNSAQAFNTVMQAVRAYRGTADDHDALRQAADVLKGLVEDDIAKQEAKATVAKVAKKAKKK